MKPEDSRLDTRIMASNIPDELKKEILARLAWYRTAIYEARTTKVAKETMYDVEIK